LEASAVLGAGKKVQTRFLRVSGGRRFEKTGDSNMDALLSNRERVSQAHTQERRISNETDIRGGREGVLQRTTTKKKPGMKIASKSNGDESPKYRGGEGMEFEKGEKRVKSSGKIPTEYIRRED